MSREFLHIDDIKTMSLEYSSHRVKRPIGIVLMIDCGLTPIEAMSAALPSVVSDWDGYREGVRDGVDGFRIPTLALAPGRGGYLADRYDLGVDNFDYYSGYTGQFVAVDVELAAAASAS